MSINSIIRQLSTRICNIDKYIIDSKLSLGGIARDNHFRGARSINGVVFLKNLRFFKFMNREDYYTENRGLSQCTNINNIRTIGCIYKYRYGSTLRGKMYYRSSFYKDTVEDVRY